MLARAADTLWEADNATARLLFVRAWDAAEAADAEAPTITSKDVPKGVSVAFVRSLRKREGTDLRVEVLALALRRDRTLGEQFLAKLKSETDDSKNASTSYDVFSGSEASLKRLLVAKDY